MTNDAVHASIAACLVQANLSFATLIGQSGDKPVRVFQLEFATTPTGGAPNRVTGYVAGPVLIVVAPLVLGDLTMRQEMADKIASRFPLVRIVPSPSAADDQDVVWLEASVPMPQVDVGELVPPWLVVPPFMVVGAATAFLTETYPTLVSFPEKRPPLPIMVAAFAQQPAAIAEKAASSGASAKPAA